jgi:hypothetical protein
MLGIIILLNAFYVPYVIQNSKASFALSTLVIAVLVLLFTSSISHYTKK